MFQVNGNRGGRWGWQPRQQLTEAEIVAVGEDPETLVTLNILNRFGSFPIDAETVTAEQIPAPKRAGRTLTAVHTTPPADDTDAE